MEQANLGGGGERKGGLVQASGGMTHDPNATVGGVLGLLASRTPDLEQNSRKKNKHRCGWSQQKDAFFPAKCQEVATMSDRKCRMLHSECDFPLSGSLVFNLPGFS